MTKQDAQLLEVLVRQVAKNVSIDRVRGKAASYRSRPRLRSQPPRSMIEP